VAVKVLAARLALALAGAVLALASAEAALRLAGYRYTGSTYTADRALGWSLRPGAGAWEVDEGAAWTRINPHGFRDRDRTADKPPGVYRIAVLGDSYTEGRQVGMDQTYTWLAEEALNRQRCAGGSRFEVLNFGVPGYGTAQERLLLRQRVWSFSPDLVVLQFYSGNDLFNNHRALNISSVEKAPYFVLRSGRLELDERFREGREFEPLFMAAKNMIADIMNRSVLLLMAYKALRVEAQQRELARAQGPDEPPRAPGAGDRSRLPPDYQRYLAFLPPTIEPMIEAWQVTERLILEIDEEVRARRARLLLMLMPTEHQIHPDPTVRDAYRARFHIESLEYADDRVAAHAHRHGIPVLRLSAPLIDEAGRTGAYMAGFANTGPNEGHLNERGHAVVARELVAGICGLTTPHAAP
jgi:lysophospholipase L1-like esterase